MTTQFSPDTRLAAALADNYLAFKDSLREAREDLGLSPTDIADRLGVDPEVVLYMESHESDPTFGELHDYLLAAELKVTHAVRAWRQSADTVIRMSVPVHSQPTRRGVIDVELSDLAANWA